jgi:hypothetical protein
MLLLTSHLPDVLANNPQKTCEQPSLPCHDRPSIFIFTPPRQRGNWFNVSVCVLVMCFHCFAPFVIYRFQSPIRGQSFLRLQSLCCAVTTPLSRRNNPSLRQYHPFRRPVCVAVRQPPLVLAGAASNSSLHWDARRARARKLLR